jgi:hypothetical protein
MDSLVESEGEPELPLERGMIASTVAHTLTRLAFCERELRACKPISPDGCWAAALRYIRLARQMLEAAEVSAVRAGHWTSPLGVEGSLTNPSIPGGQDDGGVKATAVHG